MPEFQLDVEVRNSRPRFASQGYAPRGFYRVEIADTEPTEDKNHHKGFRLACKVLEGYKVEAGSAPASDPTLAGFVIRHGLTNAGQYTDNWDEKKRGMIDNMRSGEFNALLIGTGLVTAQWIQDNVGKVLPVTAATFHGKTLFLAYDPPQEGQDGFPIVDVIENQEEYAMYASGQRTRTWPQDRAARKSASEAAMGGGTATNLPAPAAAGPRPTNVPVIPTTQPGPKPALPTQTFPAATGAGALAGLPPAVAAPAQPAVQWGK